MDVMKVINRDIEITGEDKLTCIAMEECAELIQAISKCKRYGCTEERRENLIEEIADVYLMIDVLGVIFGVTRVDIELEYLKKLNRTWERLGGTDE